MRTDSQEILLVEDNPYDAELAIRTLKSQKLTTTLNHVKDGEEALDFLHARGKFSDRQSYGYPSIIFLDLKLPKLNGLEVLKEIKNNSETKCIPVVILTSSKEVTDIKDCYSFGANSYIVKPLDFDEFTNTIGYVWEYWTQINQPYK